jgi:hypothetical protein
MYALPLAIGIYTLREGEPGARETSYVPVCAGAQLLEVGVVSSMIRS